MTLATTAKDRRNKAEAELAVPSRAFASRLWRSLGYSPHAGQVAFHTAQARNRLLAAGRRVGKSECGAGELDVEAAKTKLMLPMLDDEAMRREFWIVGPEYTDSEKEFRKHYDALKKVSAPFDKPGTYYDAHSGDMQLSLYKGKYLVLGKSAQHQERLVGEGLSGVIMAEAAKQKESTWTKYIRPTLSDFKGWSIHTSTPEGRNWFYDLWMMGQDVNNPDWWSARMPAWVNPYVYGKGATDTQIAHVRKVLEEGTLPDYGGWNMYIKNLGINSEIAELARDLTTETFNQEIAALFTEFAGRVFKDFDEEAHVRDLRFDTDPTTKTYAAVDYGFTNPFVWLLIQEDIDGNVMIIDEMYERGLTIDEAAYEVDSRGLCPSGLLEFYPDPSSPGDTRALERHLKVKSTGGTGGELSTRLRYIRSALKDRNRHLPIGHEDRHPKLLINRRCKNTIREFNIYRYPDRKKNQDLNAVEAPMKKDDHTPEALGRFYAGHYGQPEHQTGETRVTTAQVR